jgi:hypothetical protein
VFEHKVKSEGEVDVEQSLEIGFGVKRRRIGGWFGVKRVEGRSRIVLKLQTSPNKVT